MSAASRASSSPEYVQQCYEAMLEHVQEWSSDRATALAIRRSCYLPDSRALYQCDDKCGSFWQALPVDPSGRHGKATAAHVYHFCIQANVVCGEDGLIRFAMVPKQVDNGSNFGLTNFILAIYEAWEKGRLPNNVRACYRHTDGGPDNISHVSHVLHWLLVYLGVFDEIIWFRFEAGYVSEHPDPHPSPPYKTCKASQTYAHTVLQAFSYGNSRPPLLSHEKDLRHRLQC